MSEVQASSRWFSYLVATALGLSFLVTLVFLALHNALESEQQEFNLQSLSLSDSVSRNVAAIEDVTNNLATLVSAVDASDEQAFELFSRSILSRYPFIEATSYHPLVPDAGRAEYERRNSEILESMDESPETAGIRDHYLPAYYAVARSDGEGLTRGYDLLSNAQFAAVIRAGIRSGNVVPSPVFENRLGGSRYLLVKAIYSEKGPTAEAFDATLNTQGVVAVTIAPQQLLGQLGLTPHLQVDLVSESEGVAGRQVLFRRATVSTDELSIAEVSKENLIQFSNYRIRLIVNRTLSWRDLQWGLVFTALVLGIGISLLLIALARAKEVQNRELMQRNLMIEEQVESQTKALAEARDQALEASRVKSEFLASMSHEIRTPLNAIIGMAELLSETKLGRDQTRYVEVFRKSGEALLSLVNDILDLSKIEADQLELEKIPFNIRQVIDETVEIYAIKTDAKGLELVSYVDHQVPTIMLGDPMRLRQIVLNLIGNAIKFTDDGEIVVRVYADTDRDDKGRLQFSVSDTGIGIPKEKLETIFKSFTQVDSSTTRRYGGTGLGLTISQRLVQLMGGRIWAESEQGIGSTFVFTVRLEEAEAQQQELLRVPNIDLGGKRVLVVDDNATNRMIIGEILTRQSAEVVQASGGRPALDAYEAAEASGETFDFLLLDCKMSEMDGFELAEHLKEQGGAAETIMMLTSSDLASHLHRARELGLGAYLVKPIKTDELLKGMSQALTQRADAASVEAQVVAGESDDGQRSLRILLVEDNIDNRMLVKAYLKKTSHVVEEAENGAEAVKMYKEGKYDLVFMDVQMPVMDGYEATRMLRAWESQQGWDKIPIIALTAHAIKEDVEKSIRAGCTAHLTKPIKKAVLLDAIVPYAKPGNDHRKALS
jgi:signal transduction histidine kinase/DNA-binding response OmpR family regulator